MRMFQDFADRYLLTPSGTDARSKVAAEHASYGWTGW